MLAIKRRPGQSFTIGNHIEIKIVSVRGDNVKILIDAPKYLPVLRDDAINREPKSLSRVGQCLKRQPERLSASCGRAGG